MGELYLKIPEKFVFRMVGFILSIPFADRLEESNNADPDKINNNQPYTATSFRPAIIKGSEKQVARFKAL